MSAPKDYERDDDEIETPASALWGKEGNKRYVENVKKAEHVSMMLSASWTELSTNKSATLLEHIKFAKAVVEGMNKAGDQFYLSLEKTNLPLQKVKYYIELLLSVNLTKARRTEFSKAFSNKHFIQIGKNDLDGRILKLTELSIKNMKNPSPYKIRNMKALTDEEFDSVLSGDDAHYVKVDKKRQTADELERSKIEFSKEHKVHIGVIDFHLKDVSLNPLKYVEQNLELAATQEKLERVERLYRAILKEQLVNVFEEPEQLADIPTTTQFFRPSNYRTQKKAEVRKLKIPHS